MTQQLRALEYVVEPDGRVSTQGEYRIIDEAQWTAFQAQKIRRHTRYDPIMAQLRAGRIVAISTHGVRDAWLRMRVLQQRAAKEALELEAKRGPDPEAPHQHLLMVRRKSD